MTTVRRIRRLLLASCLAAFPVAGHDIHTHIVNLVDLSGPGAGSGAGFRAGVELAQKELALTLIVGTPIQWLTVDTRSDPASAREIAKKAIEEESPYVVMASVLHESTRVIAEEAGRSLVLTVVQDDSPDARADENPFLIRATLPQSRRIARIARYLRDVRHARGVDVLTSRDDYGTRGRTEIGKALAARGIEIVGEVVVDPGTRDFRAAAAQFGKSRADAVLIYLDPDQAGSAMHELRAASVGKLFIGDSRLVAPKALAQAGPAAEGAVALVEMTPDSPLKPIRAFAARFAKEYGRPADEDAMKGYAAMYMVSAVTEELGRRSPRAFAKKVRNLSLSTIETPGLLLDLTFDDNGAMDRSAFAVEIRGGKQILVDTLAPDAVAVNCGRPRC